MPISINALFGIPTREEKFTAARDAKLQEYALDKERELNRLLKDRDSHISTLDLNRLDAANKATSARDAALHGYDLTKMGESHKNAMSTLDRVENFDIAKLNAANRFILARDAALDAFGAARDQRLHDLGMVTQGAGHKQEIERMNESDRIRRDHAIWAEAQARKHGISTLVDAGMPPDQAAAGWAQAMSAPVALGINQYARQAGRAGDYDALGRAEVGADIKDAEARGAESANRRTWLQTLADKIPILAHGSYERDDATNYAATEEARERSARARHGQLKLERTGDADIAATLSTLNAVPQLTQQQLSAGGQDVDRGALALDLARINKEMLQRSADRDRATYAAEDAFIAADPSILAAKLRAQASEADKVIFLNQQLRELMKDPESARAFFDMVRPPDLNKPGGWRQGVQSMSPQQAQDPMLQGLQRFINLNSNQ